MADPETPKIECFLRRNLRSVALQGGMEQRRSVFLMHGSFMGLKRTGELPAFDDVASWGRDLGLGREDLLILKGVFASVEDGERNLGRLSIEARSEDLVVSMTRDEAMVARQALFLLLHGPFCNSHEHGGDPFEEASVITGCDERDFRALFDALDERMPPRDLDAEPWREDAGPIG